MEDIQQSSGSAKSRFLGSAAQFAALFTTAGLVIERAEAQSGAVELSPLRIEGAPTGDYRVDRAASPKLTAPLLDTPQTVTVIPQAVFQEQGARNLTEVLRNTPGISFSAGENGFATSTNNFSLRGFDSSGNVFIDNARDSGSYARDVFNVEQVEVFKGAAADNGRGGPGGYVNLVTKTPKWENFAAGGASMGFDELDTDPRYRTTVDGNYVVHPNVALRLNALLEDGGIAGREEAERDTWGVAPSIALGQGTDLRAILAYEHLERDERPDWGVPGATVAGLFRFDPTADEAPRGAYYGLSSDFDETESDAVLVRLEYDFSERLTLSNQTRWSRVDREARYTIPTGYAAATQEATTQTQFYGRENTSLSNQTNLSFRFATGAFRHNLSTGLELTREESDADRFGTINAGNTDVFNPDRNRAGAAPLAPTQRNSIEIDTAAIYAYDTIELGERWEVTGGLRAEEYRVKIDSQAVGGGAVGGVDGLEDSEFSLGGKVGVVYKPAASGSLYASFGVSTLPPGSFLSNPDISRTGDNAFPGFVDGADPVRSYNYEVGVKWSFLNDRLATSAAVFRTDKTNVAITGRQPGDTADSLQGYGEQIVQGIEVGVAGRINDAWSIFGGLALIDSERRLDAELDAARRLANPGDYGTYQTTDGDELSFTPRVSGSIWTTYRFPFGLTLGGGLQHVGSSFLGRPDDALRIIPNGIFGKLPSYTLFNVMASYELIEGVDLRFNIDNLTDEEYAVTTNWNGNRATMGPPRTYMLSMNFQF